MKSSRRRVGFNLEVPEPIDDVEEVKPHLYVMPCDTNVGPEEEKAVCPVCSGSVKMTVSTCSHKYKFLRQDTITFDTEEEECVMPEERYDIWVCEKCLRYEGVQV